MEAAFIHPDIPVEMSVEWPEGIVDLGIITKKFMEKYFILLGSLMYCNVDTALFRLRLLSKYLINKCNLKEARPTHEFFIENMTMVSWNY